MPVTLTQRLYAIDALRGLVILIMLLDHVRETFYLHKQVPDPMQIGETEPALFWSRVAAHLCAPVFVLLTGLSAYLYQLKQQSLAKTRVFLFKRGLFLVLLELTVINFAWTATFPPQTIYLQVIWAIGVSMMALALLLAVPWRLQLLLALIIIAGHNLLDAVHFNNHSLLQPMWSILHERGWLYWGELRLRTSYPVLPWIGIILWGYLLGRLYRHDVTVNQRQTMLLSLGLGCVIAFVGLRWLNVYGDAAWIHHGTMQMNLMSFFNLTKYPPSLLFILWNCGFGILLLWAMQQTQPLRLYKPLLVFGAAPMFFYVLHLYVLKLLYVAIYTLQGANAGLYWTLPNVPSLWLCSVVLAFILYPLVKAFARYKQQHPEISWLKYF